jgi:glycosyltransferase involved in cell wall biosynthesis
MPAHTDGRRSPGHPLTAPRAGVPVVSVIIPVRNEERALGPCLDAVLAQTYPAQAVEILVVDGRSADGSRDVAAAYARRDPRVRLLSNPAGTIPAGLNVGIGASRGDVVARVDARVRLAPDYLETAVGLLRSTGADNVGGPVRSVTRTVVGQALAAAWSSRLGLGDASARYGDGAERWTDTVYLGVVPRRIFDSIGLYDEGIVQDEDTEFNYRLRARGGRILLSPRLRSEYLNDPSLARIARKNFAFGVSKVAVWRKHPGMLKLRHFVPPLFVVAVAVGPLLAWFHHVLGALWLLLVASYAAACLVTAGGRYLKGRESGALLLPVVLPLIHLSWGAGFLVGVLGMLTGRRPLGAGRDAPVALVAGARGGRKGPR